MPVTTPSLLPLFIPVNKTILTVLFFAQGYASSVFTHSQSPLNQFAPPWPGSSEEQMTLAKNKTRSCNKPLMGFTLETTSPYQSFRLALHCTELNYLYIRCICSQDIFRTLLLKAIFYTMLLFLDDVNSLLCSVQSCV